MRRRHTSYVIGLAIVLLPVFTVPAQGATACPELEPVQGENGPKRQVAANLTGAQVVETGGDPDGTGTVVLSLQTVYNNLADISFQLDTTNVATPLEGAHIHKAPVGQTYRSVAELFGFTNDADRSGVITVSKCLAHDIFQRPADYYVDVHNQEYPDQGAIRGQLSDGV